MNKINGVILIVCCFKYKNIREKYKLEKTNYNGWEVIYLFGDENLDKDYILENNTLTVKCEDSYLYLMKKLILGIKYLYENYNIKEGILRCGDDLIFNNDLLLEFLNNSKNDYIGKNFIKKSIIEPIQNINLNETKNNRFMINYYNRNLIEKENITKTIQKYNNKLSIDDLNITVDIGEIIALGHIYYLSNKSCKILLDNFNYDILTYESNCFPYILEDVGVGYLLFKNNIDLTFDKNMWFNPHYQNFDEPGKYMCFHTNEGN